MKRFKVTVNHDRADQLESYLRDANFNEYLIETEVELTFNRLIGNGKVKAIRYLRDLDSEIGFRTASLFDLKEAVEGRATYTRQLMCDATRLSRILHDAIDHGVVLIPVELTW